MQLNRNLWPERCSSWALKVGREVSTGMGLSTVLQMVPTVEPCWLSQLWDTAQVWSILKFLRDLTEVAGSSSDLSHLRASARDLCQTVEVNISAFLQWWKICFISLYGATCSPGMRSGKAKMRGKGLRSSAKFCHVEGRNIFASRKASQFNAIYCF